MADVSIDSAIGTNTARGIRSVVFVTPDIGYWFYIDSSGRFGYSKTTDGGATWGAHVVTDALNPALSYDVWFDQWTPGDSGTKIHTVYFDSGNDDIFYRSLDTNGDTLGTQVVVEAEASAAGGVYVHASITKAVGGNLYISWECDISGERGFERSTDGGATWAARTIQQEATGDVSMLFPANAADTQDIWAVYHDADVDALTLKAYDDSANTWSESATIATVVENTTNLIGSYAFAASLRHSDGHLIVTAVTARDTATADHRVFDVNGTGSITELTAITTDIDDHYYPQIFIDQSTDDIYLPYNGKRDGSEVLDTTTKVYYTKSTDGGTTWSAGDTAYMEGAAGVVVQVWAPLMGPRFYVGWRVGSTLVGNFVNSLTFAGVATRFYFYRTGGIPPISPAVDSAWERFSGARIKTVLAKVAGDGVGGIGFLFGDTATSEYCSRQAISPPLAGAQTISGTVSMVMRCLEESANEDAHLAFVLRVLSNDGTTVRGTLASVMAPSTEFVVSASTPATRIHVSVALTPVNALVGDRLVMEVGVHGITPANVDIISISLGADSALGDYALTEGLTTNLTPWWEIIGPAITFDPEPATRFYLPIHATHAAALSPGVDASWERSISGFKSRRAIRDFTGSPDNTQTLTANPFGSTSTSETCFAQWVSDPLDVDQVLSGTVSLVLRAFEGGVDEDGHLAFVLRVLSRDGSTVRGTLASVMIPSTEFGLSLATRIHVTVALTPVNALVGDRLVMEVGAHGVTPANVDFISLEFGVNAAFADYALTEGLTTSLNPWWEITGPAITFAAELVGRSRVISQALNRAATH